MKNRNTLFRTRSRRLCAIALLAALALAPALLASCDDGSGGGGGADSALNGTWRASNGADTITFSGGTMTMTDPSMQGAQMRGPYSTSGGQITMTINEVYIPQNLATQWGTTTGWKTRSQMAALGLSDALLNSLFPSGTFTYSVSGNTLTLDGDTYTRQ